MKFIRALVIAFICTALSGCICPYCGKFAYVRTNTYGIVGKSMRQYKACDDCMDKVCHNCKKYSEKRLYEYLCDNCRMCVKCGTLNCYWYKDGNWYCEKHYCHKHGKICNVVYSNKLCCAVCVNEIEAEKIKQEKKSRDESRKELERKALEKKKKEEVAERVRQEELRKRLQAVKIDSIFGIRFGEKFNWKGEKEFGEGYFETELKKPFRGFKTFRIAASQMRRAYAIRMSRSVDGPARAEDLLKEKETIVNIFEEKYGMKFMHSESENHYSSIFTNTNVDVEISFHVITPRDTVPNGGVVIMIIVINKEIQNKDGEEFRKSLYKFKPFDKKEGADLL